MRLCGRGRDVRTETGEREDGREWRGQVRRCLYALPADPAEGLHDVEALVSIGRGQEALEVLKLSAAKETRRQDREGGR